MSETKTVTKSKSWRNRISVGGLISEGFKVTFANLAPFLIIAMICQLPVMIWDYSELNAVQGISQEIYNDEGTLHYDVSYTSTTEFNGLYFFGRILLSLVMGSIATAAMVYGTVRRLSGERVPIGECLSKGLSRLLPVIGVGLVTGIIYSIGLICLIIPGIILFCMYYVAVPTAVMENVGIGGAMKRSVELTKGHRWDIFLTIFVMAIIGFVPTYIIKLAVGEGFAGWTIIQLEAIFFSAVGSVISAVAYTRLREKKDGVDVGDLAKIFE